MTPDTTIFVTTIGDAENFADCMEHLGAQTVKRPIDVIDHVAPLSAALQQMNDRCATPFYVQVDEDMILLPQSIETLEMRMREAPANIAVICAPLWDCDTERALYGVKIYRRELMRHFPYQDTLSCELDQLARVTAAGFMMDLLPFTDRSTCLGEHGKHNSPKKLFKRWQRILAKREQLNNCAWVEPWPGKLLERYARNRDVTHLYGLLGAIAGIVGEPAPDRELDWRETNAELERIELYFPS